MTTEPVTRKKFHLLEWIRRGIQTRILSGLLIVVPVVVTLYILQFLYSFTAGLLAPLVKRLLIGEAEPSFAVTAAVAAISVCVFLGVLYLIGMIMTDMVGRRLIGLVEAIISRIPLIKTIYGASKQIVDTISFREGSSGFQSVALVEFPTPNHLTVGFVTGRLPDGTFKVFVPTTPNITVGFLELCPPDTVRNCDLTIEEAVKIIVSGGLICPECIHVSPATSFDSVPVPSDTPPEVHVP